jgi:hypothetical protein
MHLMDDLTEIHVTARSYFLAKITNGEVPEVVSGGEYDGLRHFPIELAGETCWLTEDGLRIPRYEDGTLILGDDPLE